MTIKDPITTLLSDVALMLDEMDYPTPGTLARALGMQVISGPVAAINLEPPPTIHLPDYMRGFWRQHTLAHEIAHGLLQWRGIDAELLAYYAPECAYSNLEALANHVAGLICLPKPFYDSTLKKFGFTPEAMIFMCRTLGAPLDITMQRTVYESDSYNRAAFLFKRGYVHTFASTFWIEVQPYDYIDDPEDRFPGVTLTALEGLPGQVLATWLG